MASPSSAVETIVLIGKTGHGKSATGNSLLGRKAFNSMANAAGVTSTTEMRTTVLENGQNLAVIDTPGLFDSSSGTDFVETEIAKCIDLANDGLHAIVLVLSIKARFTKEEEAVVKYFRSFFGPKIIDYMIVLFTGGDQLEDNETLDDYLGYNCPKPLTEVLRVCGNRRILFNNKTGDESKKSEQRKQFLSLVNDMVAKNGGKPYIEVKSLWIPARNLSITWVHDTRYWKWTQDNSCRSEVAELLNVCWLEITARAHVASFNQKSSYSAFLVFKLQHNSRNMEKATASVRFLKDITDETRDEGYTVFIGSKENADNRRNSRFHHLRSDGWLEIKLGEFFTDSLLDGNLEMRIFEKSGIWKSGLTVRGIEVRLLGA